MREPSSAEWSANLKNFAVLRPAFYQVQFHRRSGRLLDQLLGVKSSGQGTTLAGYNDAMAEHGILSISLNSMAQGIYDARNLCSCGTRRFEI